MFHMRRAGLLRSRCRIWIRDLGRDDAKLVPIIALTANAFDSDVQASLEAGMNAHLAKPTDSDMLYDTLRRFIAAAEKAGYKGNE